MEVVSVSLVLIIGIGIGVAIVLIFRREKQTLINDVMTVAKEKLESERDSHVKELDTKKSLIDQQLERMNKELENVSNVVRELEKDREKKFGEVTKYLEEAGKQTGDLIRTTSSLREALASPKARGQWGERMAEDILRIAGFVENVNYIKQQKIESSGERPDFTFLLPRKLTINMDVKFPLDNYLRFLDAASQTDRDAYVKSFIRDVKGRIGEVTSRNYINPDQNTVDYVILFIPNEQVFSFIYEKESSLFDDGLSKRVIMCSPLTLFAVLAIIRSAVDNFTFEQKSNEILSLISSFKAEWGKFLKSLESVGKHIERAQDEFAKLTTTRMTQLERPLKAIDRIRMERGITTEIPQDISLLETDDNEENGGIAQ